MKNNLQFLVESNEINISKLAKELKVSRSTIYRVMDGGVPSAELLLKISYYFDNDARNIFFIPTVRQIVQKKKGVS